MADLVTFIEENAESHFPQNGEFDPWVEEDEGEGEGEEEPAPPPRQVSGGGSFVRGGSFQRQVSGGPRGSFQRQTSGGGWFGR